MSDFASRYRMTIEQIIGGLTTSLIDGGATTFENYKEISGKIAGLKMALLEFDDIVSRFTVDD